MHSEKLGSKIQTVAYNGLSMINQTFDQNSALCLVFDLLYSTIEVILVSNSTQYYKDPREERNSCNDQIWTSHENIKAKFGLVFELLPPHTRAA